MAAIRYAFDSPLQPLGLLLPDGIGAENELVSRLIWREAFAVPLPLGTPTKPIEKPRLSQAELVDSLVVRAVRSFEEDGHMFSLGYRKAGYGNFDTKIGGGAIECRFPNWIVSYLKTIAWECLLKEIGDSLMTHILWELPFVAIRHDGSLTQVTGRPFPNILNEVGREMEDTSRKPSTIGLRTFGQAFSTTSKKNAKWKLPPTYCLNKLQIPGASVSREQARKLAVIMLTSTETQSSGPEERSSAARVRVGEPWKSIIPYLQKVIDNQRRCPYSALYDRAKRSVQAHLGQDQDFSTEVALLSLRQYETPYAVIERFLKLCLLRIVPRQMWGTRSTRRSTLSSLEQYVVRANLVDPIPWRRVLMQLHVDSFSWLRFAFKNNAKMAALKIWMDFLFTNLSMAILSAFFFMVRDEQGNVVYYTKRVWKSSVMNDIAQEQLQFERLSQVQMKEANRRMLKRRFGGPRIRFIKKRKLNDFRVIMNLSFKDPKFNYSVNMALRPAFHALTYEVGRDPSLGGSFVSGIDSIYPRLLTYLRSIRLKQGLGKGEPVKLFAVAMDVRKCFDTMRHELVMKCCSDAISEDEYAIATHSLSFADFGMRRVRTRRVKTVKPAFADTKPERPDAPRSLVETNRPSRTKHYVVTDGVSRQYVTRERVLGLIEELVEHTYVSFANQWYRMRCGVPQGSVVSTLLCRIYYGAFEKAEVRRLVNDEEDLLMRLVDDFFLLTPNRQRMEAFRDTLQLGNEKWGCFINEEKTRTAGYGEGQNRWIPWCGLLIDVNSGEVRVHYDGQDHFSGARVFQRGVGKSMRAAFAVKCRSLLLDLEINSCTNVCLNIGQIFVVCATRFIRYLSFLGLRRSNLETSWMSLNEVDDLFEFAHALIHSRVKYEEEFLTRTDVACLGWNAFASKFSREFGTIPSSLECRFGEYIGYRLRGCSSQVVDWITIRAGIDFAAKTL